MPLSQAKSRGAGEAGGGDGADADDDQIRRVAGAVGANYALDPVTAFEPDHPHIADDVDAVAAMLVGKILRHAGRDHAIHDPIGHFQHRDLAVHRAASRRGLEADVAAADDDDPTPRV